MALTQVQQIMVEALGAARTQVAAQIAAVQAIPLPDLEQQLADIETQLQAIDPTIPTLAQEAQSAQTDPDQTQFIKGP